MDDASGLERATPRTSSRFGLPISPEALELWDEIERLDLVRNVAELEVLGWTVIPPEQAAPPGFCDRLRDKILEVAARRDGRPADTEAGASHTHTNRPIGGLYTYLLFEDPIFQEAMCNPIGMALTTYLLGKNAIASNCIGGLKGPGDVDLGLHSDNALMVAPFPSIHWSATSPMRCRTTPGRMVRCASSRAATSICAIQRPARAWTNGFPSSVGPARSSSGAAMPGTAPSRAPHPACVST